MVRSLSRLLPCGAGAAHGARAAARRVTGGGRPRRARRPGDAGTQTLEFALVVPAVLLVAIGLVHLALAGADLIGVQVLAREAARAAAVGEDPGPAVREAAGGRPVEVELQPRAASARETVTVTVRVRSRLGQRLGVDVWLPGRATMRREPGA